MYYGIVFEDASRAVVPESWLTRDWLTDQEETTLVHWPNKEPHKKAEKQVEPNLAWWKTFPCTIKLTAPTWEECQLGLTSGENVSTEKFPLKNKSGEEQQKKKSGSSETRPEGTLSEEVLEQIATLSANLDSLAKEHAAQREKLEEALALLSERTKKEKPAIGDAAATLEELDGLARSPGLIAALKAATKGAGGPKQTVNKILKRILTKDLAAQFSTAAYDNKNENAKLIFANHAICRKIIRQKNKLGLDIPEEDILEMMNTSLNRAAKNWK